jgi:hypothetical protein
MKEPAPARILSRITFGALFAGLLACGSQTDSAASSVPRAEASTFQTAPSSNAAPRIDDLRLEPSSPFPGDRVRVAVEAHDPEGDTIQYGFSWSIDGAAISNPDSDLVLRDVAKGSEVVVRVVTRDAHSEGAGAEASAVVANRPPEVTRASIERTGLDSGDHDLRAVVRGFDADDDAIDFEYEWQINQRVCDTRGATLSHAHFRRDDEIGLRVRAWDGEDRSAAFTAATIQVVNAAPRIVSTPTRFGGRHFRYTPEVDDPDGDRGLRFALVEGPAGMTLDLADGELQWWASDTDVGEHRVEIEVSDRHGGSDRQVFVLRLDVDSGLAPAAIAR